MEHQILPSFARTAKRSKKKTTKRPTFDDREKKTTSATIETSDDYLYHKRARTRTVPVGEDTPRSTSPQPPLVLDVSDDFGLDSCSGSGAGGGRLRLRLGVCDVKLQNSVAIILHLIFIFLKIRKTNHPCINRGS